MLRSKGKIVILTAPCPDKQCRSKMFFPHFDTSIECTHCGQRHNRSTLQNIQEVSDMDDGRFGDIIRNIVISNFMPKHGTETVKVMGLSNYHCKLVSPLLTKYGMDKTTKQAKLLAEMNQGDIFDCGLFGDRAFLIDQEHINVPGFGIDLTGSSFYLSKTLELIRKFNDGEERLLPIHSDGDGHCLVHAVSRALVGRELFWHPLRCSLKKHFEDNLPTYRELFKDFVDESEWRHIIAECDPNFIPPEGELLGLRNIHIFGLSNVLKRPIILLDSLECMHRSGDYAALFLPTLVAPELCRGKNNQMNKPLCIAWSCSGHNHYIPLVGIKKKPLPVLPLTILPKAWGVPQCLVFSYIEFDEKKNCTIGGDRSLGDPYIQRLVHAMEDIFGQKYGVHPALVADVHHYLYQRTGVVGADRKLVVQKTKTAVEERRLYRCLNCEAICEQVIKQEWFSRGGVLFNVALKQYGGFIPNELYPFPLHGIVCRYNDERNELQPDMSLSGLESCTWCGNTVRKVRADGSIIYRNSDTTKTHSFNGCGYKTYWDGKEYDNPPQKLNVMLNWNNKVINDNVIWFENESNTSLNSNAYKIASDVVQKHFPGEFGSEVLVQRVVEQLLNQTKIPDSTQSSCPQKEEEMDCSDVPPSKITIPGTGVLHKEELGVSETECQILQRIKDHAPQQKRQSSATVTEKCNKPCTEVTTKESTSISDCDPDEQTVATNSPSAPITNSKTDSLVAKFIRVATSDGRQGKLTLKEKGITYDELQQWIMQEFQIFEPQKIKYGFPPEELKPNNLQPDKVLPLSHGDRIMVEVMPKIEDSMFDSLADISEFDPKRKSMELDLQILHLSIEAFNKDQSFWDYVKRCPKLFQRDGLFYSKLDCDLGGLQQKPHTFICFPDKIFCYDTQKDAIMLYVPSLGFFEIHEFVDEDVRNASQFGHSSTKLLSREQRLSSNPQPGTSLLSSVQEQRTTSYILGKEVSFTSSTSASNEELKSLVRRAPGYSVLSKCEKTTAKPQPDSLPLSWECPPVASSTQSIVSAAAGKAETDYEESISCTNSSTDLLMSSLSKPKDLMDSSHIPTGDNSNSDVELKKVNQEGKL